MLLRTKLTTIALAASGIALGACSSATMHDAEGGAYVSDGAWIKSVESASLEDVYQASEAALRDLDLEVQKREQRALAAQLSAEEADGTNVTVDLEQLNDNTTRLAIKVGTFGDESISRMVLDKIRANLGTTSATGRASPEARTTPAGFREDADDRDDINMDDDEAWLSEPPADENKPRND